MVAKLDDMCSQPGAALAMLGHLNYLEAGVAAGLRAALAAGLGTGEPLVRALLQVGSCHGSLAFVQRRGTGELLTRAMLQVDGWARLVLVSVKGQSPCKSHVLMNPPRAQHVRLHAVGRLRHKHRIWLEASAFLLGVLDESPGAGALNANQVGGAMSQR